MRNSCLFVALLIVSLTANAQIYNRAAADSLIVISKQPQCDSCRANTLISISDFLLHLRKISADQLDTVRNEMAEVKSINASLHKASIDDRLLLLQALYLKSTGKSQAGKQRLNVLINKLDREGNQYLLGGAYYELSDFFSGDLLQPTMSKRIYYLKKSIKAYEKTQSHLSLGRDYRFLADLHLVTDSLGRAFVEANIALSEYRIAGYQDIQGILALLGRLYFSQQNYKDAIKYELMALNQAKKSKQDNVRLICQINNTLGTIFLKINDFPDAFNYYTAALNIAKQEKDNGTVYLLAANLVNTYLKAKQGQQAISFFKQINKSFPVPKRRIYEAGDFWVNKTFLKIYITLGLFDKARPYYQQVLEEIKNPNIDFYSLSEYYDLVVRANIGLHNFKLASVFLDKNEKLLYAIKDYSDLSVNFRLKAALDTVQGDYRKGMRHILVAQQIEDSLFNATKASQIEQLQVAYTSSEKQSQISALQQNANVERANLQKANLLRDFLLGSTVGFLIIALLLRRQNQQKKHHNEIIVQNNRQLGDLLSEKEWLLKEVHHRVKNNLHTVVCLLESQAYFLTDDALHAVESSRCRIYAMSLIHQKFYQSDNVRSIEMKSYISELVLYLTESFGYPENICTVVDVEDINLTMSDAIPVGLIINEAVNNAYKYAFPGNRRGEITINLRRFKNKNRLEIIDNGIGIPFDPSDAVTDSLGIELMKGLVTDLKGTITFLSGVGTGIIVVFRPEDLAV